VFFVWLKYFGILTLMSIYFIRHGESQSNKDGIFAGQLDVPITDLGISQAREAGKKLKMSGLKIDAIFSSPLMRAHATAIEVARAIDFPIDQIVLDPRLKERNLGTFEGQPSGDISRMPAMSESDQLKEGMETISLVKERAGEMLQALEALDGNILIVSHNGFGRGLFAVKHGVAFYDIKRLPNAQVIDLGETWILESK
jgi:broad specificity phosphatase PhoE